MNLREWKELNYPVSDSDREHFRPLLESIMGAHSRLNDFGMGVYAARNKSTAECQEFMRINKLRLTESLDDVVRTCNWIRSNVTPIRSINRKHTSYGLKHVAEKQIGYITNGVFIAAALIEGYLFREDFGPNVQFAMSEASIKQANKLNRTVPRCE